ncbi:TPA: phenylalanine--tRNA ligase subunit beta [Candidatus Uhrbacteria bacterium]|nr:phenylalanine--tRNA ligase subunit beta [Candidatus Uhrbacteria bacterium]
MNILISYNWMKEYLDTDLSPEEFAKQTTASGNSVEAIDRVAERFAQMVVGVVLEVKAHPNADKLRVAVVDIGTKHVEIVCGGENLSEGQKVVVALPGARVRWHGEGDLIELQETKIRGVESYGMICAASEVGFDKLPAGEKDIWDISLITNAQPGIPIAQALDLDDVIFDIEVTSNRPDCKSVIGQAREGAAVTQDPFTWKTSKRKDISDDAGFSVELQEPHLCPRYTAVVIEGVIVGPSPWWLQKRLLLAGHKPINNLVDITNYILHEYGQPLHTFDADMLEGQKIVIRRAHKGETFVALDKKTYELSSDMLVIADAKKPVAIAGVMGGLDTGTTQATTRVIIECAAFDPVSIRRTARALNLYSDSQLLFEKGLSTQALEPALLRAIELIKEVAGGEVVSKIFDESAQSYQPIVFPFDEKAANRLMGIELPKKDQIAILKRLGFTVQKNQVTVPYWRDHDIEASVDFVEEIARVYGYDQFPSQLPSGELPQAFSNQGLMWERRVKHLLAGAGLSESYSYSFVSQSQLEKYGIDVHTAVKLRNPLNSEQEYMRTSLVPSLLTSIEANQARIPQADVFELAPIYLAQIGAIPKQSLRLVIGSYSKEEEGLFVHAKGILERIFGQTGIRQWSLVSGTDQTRWHAGRSAVIVVGDKHVGTIGQVSRAVEQAFGIDVVAVLIDLDFEALLSSFTLAKTYKSIPSFPSVKRDLAFLVQERTQWESISQAVHQTSQLLEVFELFDVYRGKEIEEGKKSLAVHLSFRSSERTLEAAEVDEEIEKIRQVLENMFGAIMRS